MNDAQVYAGAAVMGAIAGMRSLSPPKVVSQFSEMGLIPHEGSPLSLLNHSGVSKILTVLSAGEKVSSKVLTKVGPITARGVAGGISGAAIASRAKRPWWPGALIGAGTAIGAGIAAYKLRDWVKKEYRIPDAVVGIVEDAIVAGAGYLVLSSLKSGEELEPATSAAG